MKKLVSVVFYKTRIDEPYKEGIIIKNTNTEKEESPGYIIIDENNQVVKSVYNYYMYPLCGCFNINN